MGLTTIVQTIDDLDVSPGSGYSAAFLHSFEQPGSAATLVETAQGPVVTHVAPGMYRLSALSIMIEDGDEAVMQVALMRALDTTRAAKSIVISDTDGENRRYMMFVTEALNQLPESAGLGYIATLIAHEDIRWRSETDITETENFTTTAGWTVNVGGHLTAYPTITVTPRGPKSTPGWQHAMTKVLRWQSPLPVKTLVPIDLTGGGWNTAALVTAGEMTSRTNIAVTDGYGRFIPHWYGAADGQPAGFNSTTTKIWVNVGDLFMPTEPTYLGESLAADATTMNVYIDTQDETALPPAGWLRLAETGEIISYNGIERGTLMGVRRGVAGTTREDHEAGELMEVVKPFQIVWDPVSTVPSHAKTAAYWAAYNREPLIDKAASTNSFWRMTSFRSGSRSVGWNYTGPKEAAFTVATDAGGSVAGFTEPWTAMGFRHDVRGNAMFYRTFAVPIDTVRLIGRKFGIGYFPQYPNSAQFKIVSARTRAWKVLWNSSHGGWGEDNDTFDETIDTPMTDPLAEIPEEEGGNLSWYYENWTLYNELLWAVTGSNCNQVDIQRIDVTFTSLFAPIVETYTPPTTYDLDMRIFNAATGEMLRLFMPGMEIDKSLVIDSLTDRVTYSGDGSNRYAAVKKIMGDGAFLMTLEPGDNVISVIEDYMSDMDVEIRYAARYYV